MNTVASNNISSFSFQRFSLLAKSEMIINKAYYLWMVIAAIGVFAAIAFLISLNAGFDFGSGYDAVNADHARSIKQVTYGSTYLLISMWVFSIGLTVLGSLTFSNFSSRKSRTAALMVPASRAEKFSLRVLIYTVAGTILLFIGFLIGAAICQFAFGAWNAIFNEIKEFFNFEFAGYIAAYVILTVLLGVSLYALGSSIWPKLSWIKTWAFLAVVQWIVSIILVGVFFHDINMFNFYRFVEDNIHIMKWIGIAGMALLNIACWILTWWRYKNIQIVQRFMTK